VNRLKSFVLGLALTVVAFSGSGCGFNNVPPGYVGIKVDYYGTEKGVSDYPVVTGMQWYNPWYSTVIEYPTFNQTAVWTKDINEGSPANEEISYASSEGMGFEADISLSYNLIPEKVPAFYVKFRNDDLRTFTHGYLRSVARRGYAELAPHYSAEQLYTDKVGELDKKVQEYVNAEVNQFGVEITQFGVIGRPRPPQELTARINAKVGAVQRAQQAENELRQTQAEAAKQVAEAEGNAKSRIAEAEGNAKSRIVEAEGQAKANALLSASINENLIKWRTVDVMSRWNGALPTYMAGAGGLPVPMVNVGQ